MVKIFGARPIGRLRNGAAIGWIVEDAAAVQAFRVGLEAAVVTKIAATGFVAPLVDVHVCARSGGGIADLVEVYFDSVVLPEVEVAVKAKTTNLLRNVIRRAEAVATTDLEVAEPFGPGKALRECAWRENCKKRKSQKEVLQR